MIPPNTERPVRTRGFIIRARTAAAAFLADGHDAIEPRTPARTARRAGLVVACGRYGRAAGSAPYRSAMRTAKSANSPGSRGGEVWSGRRPTLPGVKQRVTQTS